MKTTQSQVTTTSAPPAAAERQIDSDRPQLPPIEVQQEAAQRGHRLESLPLDAPDDLYEQEADRAAAQVMEWLESGSGPAGTIQATPTPGPAFQAKGDGGGGGSTAGVLTQLPAAPGSGRPIESAVRTPLERAMGASLSDVRLHSDRPAQQLNQSLDALATTVGRDIHFAEGEYEPESAGGRALLAHELTHVLQQRQGDARLQRIGKGKGRAPWLKRRKVPPSILPDPGDSRESRMNAGPPAISPPAPGVEDALQQRRAAGGSAQATGQGAVPASAPTGAYGQLNLAPAPGPVYSNFGAGAAQAAGQGAVPASAFAGAYGQLNLAPAPGPVYSNFGARAAQAAGQGAVPASARASSSQYDSVSIPLSGGSPATHASEYGQLNLAPAGNDYETVSEVLNRDNDDENS